MSDTHGVPESAIDKATDSQRPAAARKAEPERRTFDAEPSTRIPLTNLEAQGGAPTLAPYELPEVWRDAFAPLFAMQMEANRWFDQMWRQTTGFGALAPLRPARPFGAMAMAPALGLPAADLRETDKAYLLSVELPGLTRTDIELKIDQGQIRVCGQKLEDRDETRGDYRVSERRFGRFERSFPIPADVRRDAIAATYADGLLKIELPKAEHAQTEAKRVDIR